MSRSSTPAIVLETIYTLAKVPVPTGESVAYPGYPARITASTSDLALLILGKSSAIRAGLSSVKLAGT